MSDHFKKRNHPFMIDVKTVIKPKRKKKKTKQENPLERRFFNINNP